MPFFEVALRMANTKKHVLLRRSIMRKLTKKTGQSAQSIPVSPLDKKTVRRILICRPNHRLGNMLLISPLVQEAARIFPEARIDLFVKGGIAQVVFNQYACVDRIIMLPKKTFRYFFRYLRGWLLIKQRRYALVVNVIAYSASGKIATKMARTGHPFFGSVAEAQLQQWPDHKQVAKYPVYALRAYLQQAGIPAGHEAVPLMDLKLSQKELEQGKSRRIKIAGNDKKTIAIFTYATGSKCFPKSWWMPFYEALKARYPDYNLIEILPAENVSQIDFKARSFYSRDLREIGAFIAATEVFIGADSGMMHLASASLTPTIGLFSVTDAEAYGPYGNGSVAVRVKGNRHEECLEAVEKLLRPQ